MRRFFIPTEYIHGTAVRFPDDEARHLRTVLRLKTGTEIELFDGSGHAYRGRLNRVDRLGVEAELTGITPPQQAGGSLTLAMGMLKGQKMDMVVQKATELGVTAFMPVLTRYGAPRAGSRPERWERIMIEACKQCRRNTLMTLLEPVPLEHLPTQGYTDMFFAWEQAGPAPFALRSGSRPASVLVLIGPEGGLHTREAESLMQRALLPVGLGPLILRAETAAIALCALAQHLGGNWSGRGPCAPVPDAPL